MKRNHRPARRAKTHKSNDRRRAAKPSASHASLRHAASKPESLVCLDQTSESGPAPAIIVEKPTPGTEPRYFAFSDSEGNIDFGSFVPAGQRAFSSHVNLDHLREQVHLLAAHYFAQDGEFFKVPGVERAVTYDEKMKAIIVFGSKVALILCHA